MGSNLWMFLTSMFYLSLSLFLLLLLKSINIFNPWVSIFLKITTGPNLEVQHDKLYIYLACFCNEILELDMLKLYIDSARFYVLIFKEILTGTKFK